MASEEHKVSELGKAFAIVADAHWKIYAIQFLSAIRLYGKGERSLAESVYWQSQNEKRLSEEYNRKAFAIGCAKG